MTLRLVRRRSAMAVAAIIVMALGGCTTEGGTSRTAVKVGQPAPAYAARVLSGPDIALDSLRGDVVLLNVWATWCKPCRQEIPALDSLHRAFAPQGLRVVGVSIDLEGEEQRIAEFAKELGASYALWHDPDDNVSSTFLAIGVPATFLIDRDGVLRWRHHGPVTYADSSLNAALATALAAPRP
ncbi:MAG: TlpA family protein disulfide reductase [Gemmatimonadaceae bacterium]|nr:TlpA family protein disulfide reductase [Gemmatimonadaceae bacterium]